MLPACKLSIAVTSILRTSRSLGRHMRAFGSHLNMPNIILPFTSNGPSTDQELWLEPCQHRGGGDSHTDTTQRSDRLSEEEGRA